MIMKIAAPQLWYANVDHVQQMAPHKLYVARSNVQSASLHSSCVFCARFENVYRPMSTVDLNNVLCAF